ncbi:MAG: glycosyltransferase [Bacteroidales bacterium]|nr:glycosyltransferase [Bacteroidales bacterium]
MQFSVLMSVYYKEQSGFLCQALNSVFNQTLRTDEVVLVKDGPLTKELDDAIEKYQEQYPELKVIKLAKNGGLGKALNEGLKHCSFDIVARMDTDDISKPDRFEKQIKFLEQHPEIDVVSSWIDEFENNINNVKSTKKLPEKHTDIYKFGKKKCPVNHPTVVFRKHAVENVGSYLHFPLFEDYYLWVRLLQNGAKFYNIQESLLYFRLSPNMFKRRGGIKYGLDEIRLQNKFFSMGFINLPTYIYNVIIRFTTRIIPNKLRECIYLKLLR